MAALYLQESRIPQKEERTEIVILLFKKTVATHTVLPRRYQGEPGLNPILSFMELYH